MLMGRRILVTLLTLAALAVAVAGGIVGAALWTAVSRTSLPAAAAVLTAFVAVSVALLGILQDRFETQSGGPISDCFLALHLKLRTSSSHWWEPNLRRRSGSLITLGYACSTTVGQQPKTLN
jgi:hypothetical protein